MVKSRKAADADKRAAGRKRGGEDDSYSFDEGGGASESGDEAAATAPDLSLDALRKVFHLPCVDAAGALGVAHSKLKRRCHKLKIARWPQRKLASLVFLRDALPNDPRLSDSQREAIVAKIDSEYGRVMQDPNHPLDKELEQLRKSNYKLNYNRKLKCGGKAGKRAGSVGDTETGAAGDAGEAPQWGASPRLGAAGETGGGRGGAAGQGAGGGRAARGGPPALAMGRGSVASPTGSAQENGSAGGGGGAADSPVWDTAADDDVVTAAAAVAGFGNSPRKVVQRRLAVQLGGPSGGAGGSAGAAGLGRRSSLERAALLSVIADGKIVKQGGASRRQSGSGSGNATPRTFAGGGPSGALAGGGGGLMGGPSSPLLRRNLASPVGHGPGAAGAVNSRDGLLDSVRCGINPQADQMPVLEQLQHQQLQQLQHRPGGVGAEVDEWPRLANPRGVHTLLTHGSVHHRAHALPDAAACPGGAGVLNGGGSLGDAGGLVGGLAGGVISAGVNAILNDTSVDGLLMGLEAMVAGGGVGGAGARRSLGAEQLSEEELALLGIQGPDRDLLLDPSSDPGLDPLLDLLLMSGDALSGGGGAGAGLVSRPQPPLQPLPGHPQSQPSPLPHLPNTPHGGPGAGTTLQQLQQLHQQLHQQHRLSAANLGPHMQLGNPQPSGALLPGVGALKHQQQQQQLPAPAAGFSHARRLSDALPAVGDEGTRGDFGAAAVGVSSLLRTSASGAPMTGFTGGSGGIHSAPLRQHRLSSVTGLAPGPGQRPSRFAGGLELPSSTTQPLDFLNNLGVLGAGAGLTSAASYDERYCAGPDGGAARVNLGLGAAAQLALRYEVGADSAIGGPDAARRPRGGLLPGSLGAHLQQPHQSLQQPLNHLTHSHQHVMSTIEGRHSAPGNIGIPGWDELHGLFGSGGGGGGSLQQVGVDINVLARRGLQPTVGVAHGVPDLAAFGSSGATAAAAAQRLATATGGGDVGAAGGGGMRGGHGRSTSTSGLADNSRDAGAASLHAGRDRDQLTAREHLLRLIQGNNSGGGCGGYGSGGGGPSAAAAALGAAALTSSQQPALLPSPTEPSQGRGGGGGGAGGGTAAGVYGPGPGVSPPSETIASLQGLRLRGSDDDRLAAAVGQSALLAERQACASRGALQPHQHHLPPPLCGSEAEAGAAVVAANAAGNGDLAAMLQELQFFRRQQQEQIAAQQQQIAAQQQQIARLGALSGITMPYDDQFGGAPVGKQQQQQQGGLGPVVAAAAAAAAARQQQLQQRQQQGYEGGSGGGGGGGPVGGGSLEVLDFQWTERDVLIGRNLDLMRRNSSGFGSFINEMRGGAAGAGGSFSLGSEDGGGGGGMDVGAMRSSLRRDLRQNSMEEWEEMLRQLGGNSNSSL